MDIEQIRLIASAKDEIALSLGEKGTQELYESVKALLLEEGHEEGDSLEFVIIEKMVSLVKESIKEVSIMRN